MKDSSDSGSAGNRGRTEDLDAVADAFDTAADAVRTIGGTERTQAPSKGV